MRHEAARRLIPLDDLARALQWSAYLPEVAEELGVDVATLRARLCGLTPEERDRLPGLSGTGRLTACRQGQTVPVAAGDVVEERPPGGGVAAAAAPGTSWAAAPGRARSGGCRPTRGGSRRARPPCRPPTRRRAAADPSPCRSPGGCRSRPGSPPSPGGSSRRAPRRRAAGRSRRRRSRPASAWCGRSRARRRRLGAASRYSISSGVLRSPALYIPPDDIHTTLPGCRRVGAEQRQQPLGHQVRPEHVHGQRHLVALGRLLALLGQHAGVVHEPAQAVDAARPGRRTRRGRRRGR